MRRRTMTGVLALGLCLFATQVFAQGLAETMVGVTMQAVATPVRITNSAHGDLTLGCSGGDTTVTISHGTTSDYFPCTGDFRVQRAQGCAVDTSEQTFSFECESGQVQTTTVTADDCESALSLSHACAAPPSTGDSGSGGS